MPGYGTRKPPSTTETILDQPHRKRQRIAKGATALIGRDKEGRTQWGATGTAVT